MKEQRIMNLQYVWNTLQDPNPSRIQESQKIIEQFMARIENPGVNAELLDVAEEAADAASLEINTNSDPIVCQRWEGIHTKLRNAISDATENH